MSVTFSGSLDITGSLFVNGTAVSTGSTFNPITNFYSLANNREANVTQSLNANAGGLFSLHISASGLHKIDASTIGATSASVNVYWYPDLFTTTGSQAALYVTLNSGSGNGVVFRSLISSSTSTYYTPSLSVGNTTTNIARQSTAVMYQLGAGTTTNFTILTVQGDGNKVFSNSQTPIGTNNILGSGDKGTAIV